MTLIVACTVCALSILGASFTRDLATAAAARARAQAAADAAALAAVATSVPGRSGDPKRLATVYAHRNGARLDACHCPRGATEATVEVSVGDVVAEARAVLEPHLLAPVRSTPDLAGLHPAMDATVRRLLIAAAGSVWITSAYRSTAEQARLWESAVERHGGEEAADDWVARPGHSMHERGLAVDVGGDLDLAARLVAELRLPLHRPLPNEPWHFELVEARP